MDQNTKEIYAKMMERLIIHFRKRNDVQNIDIMNLAGFCRNCLSKWYLEVAKEKNIDVDYDKALSSAVYWAPTAIPREVREHISDPRDFESNVGEKEVEKIEKSWLITTNSEAIIKKLESLMKSGYNRVYIHSASPHEKKFLDLLGRDILPWMREYYDTLVNPITLVSD